MKTETTPNKPILVYWTLWGAILSGMMILQYIIGGGIPSGNDAQNPPNGVFAICIFLIAISTIIRWIFIPKAQNRGKLLVFMIVGLAMADGVQIFQLVLIGPEFPQKQLTVFVLAMLGALQFVPIYAKRIITNNTVQTTRASARV